MMLERGRNEPCICGSGKKFKKCCINIQYDDFKDITLLDDIPDAAFKDNRESLSEADIELIQYAYTYINNPTRFPAEAITYMHDYLTACWQRCPNNPSVPNLLYNFYRVQDEPERASELLVELLKRYPHHVYSAVAAAQESLEGEDADTALYCLKSCQTLKEFDPRRSVFHMGEAACFHGILIECYLYKGDDAAVTRHYNNLLRVVSMNPGRGYDRYIDAARESIERWQSARRAAYRELIDEYLRKKIFEKITEADDLPTEIHQASGESHEIGN